MIISKIENESLDKILEINFDLAFFACGYEVRSSHLFSKGIRFKKSICLKFTNHTNEASYIENEKTFKGIESINENQNTNQNLISFLASYIKHKDVEELNILIDYSSMSRLWYSAILFYFKYFNYPKNVNLYFSYSVPQKPAFFELDKGITFQPLEYISRILIPEKPTALIICLGDNPIQSTGLRNFFDAEKVIVFYASSKYQDQILDINNKLISEIRPENMHAFPLRDIVYTKYILNKVCHELVQNYRIIIAPCGPKTFTLSSFLVASELEEVDIWRVSKSIDKVELKEPTNTFSIVKVELQTVSN